MGRKKLVLTSFDLEKREKTAARIKALKESRKDTIKSLALFLGVGEATLRNYMHCRSSMDGATAELIAKKTGVIAPFWQGDSDAKTWPGYRAEWESAEREADSQYREEEERRIAELRSFFTRCGFTYTYAMQDPELFPRYAFGDLQDAGPHVLTSIEHPDLSGSFGEDELDAIISRISETIELEVYKKSKA